MIKVLHTIPALDGGGADRVIYDYCIRMLPTIKFDFIVHTKYVGILEKELVNRGCKIFHIPPAKEGLFQYISNIKSIMRENKYDIIHVSQGFLGYFFLYYSKKYGIRIRIAHSHMANIQENLVQKIKRIIFTNLTSRIATDFFACGKDAAIWMWGEEKFSQGKVQIMANGVDTEMFVFSEKTRNELREKWNLEDKLVIGNIGRLTYQKNQEFLLEIFKEVLFRYDNAVLLLIGRGNLRNELERKAIELEIEDKVFFLGIRDDVSKLLNMMDVFVLTSRFEGLPLVLVEAQVNGLPIVVSSAVTDEVRKNNNYIQMDLEEEVEVWAKNVIEMKSRREKEVANIINLYDINILAFKQLEWYEKRVKSE